MPRGKTAATLTLIDACYDILQEIQPASVRAVCYQLFIRHLIDSMATKHTKRVSHQLVYAREAELIPWSWIVDETRSAERHGFGWKDPDAYMQSCASWYRRDQWVLQPRRVEVWSEKGTMRGTLEPVLRRYGVTFRVMHGYGSATTVHDVAQETRWEPKPLTVFYVGDWDPSGLQMSEVDLPERLQRYGGTCTLRRLALTAADVADEALPGFPAADKQTDSRYRWFVTHYGGTCWELDALSPVSLRAQVDAAIAMEIDQAIWARCQVIEQAEQASMATFFQTWHGITGQVPQWISPHGRCPPLAWGWWGGREENDRWTCDLSLRTRS